MFDGLFQILPRRFFYKNHLKIFLNILRFFLEKIGCAFTVISKQFLQKSSLLIFFFFPVGFFQEFRKMSCKWAFPDFLRNFLNFFFNFWKLYPVIVLIWIIFSKMMKIEKSRWKSWKSLYELIYRISCWISEGTAQKIENPTKSFMKKFFRNYWKKSFKNFKKCFFLEICEIFFREFENLTVISGEFLLLVVHIEQVCKKFLKNYSISVKWFNF